LATAKPVSRRLVHPRRFLSEPSRARSPSTRPRCHGRHASLDPGAACRLLQPEYDARAHPTSVRSSHASEAFAPLHAGTNRCRLRRPARTSPHGEPASRTLYTPTCVRRVPLSWTRQAAGRSARAKANRALLDDIARALLVAPRAPGSPARFAMKPGGLHHSSTRPRSTSDAAPRRAAPSERPGCLLPRWNSYASGGWLLRARPNRSSVTPPLSKALLGNYRAFVAVSAVPSPDGEST